MPRMLTMQLAGGGGGRKSMIHPCMETLGGQRKSSDLPARQLPLLIIFTITFQTFACILQVHALSDWLSSPPLPPHLKSLYSDNKPASKMVSQKNDRSQIVMKAYNVPSQHLKEINRQKKGRSYDVSGSLTVA
jgi:hypothetical protein